MLRKFMEYVILPIFGAIQFLVFAIIMIPVALYMAGYEIGNNKEF